MKNIPALTSVRFVAALVVFIHHYLTMGGNRHFGDNHSENWLFSVLYEGRYGVEDTRQAVREAARKGQTVFAVTVDRNATEYLPHMFGRGRFAIVPRLSKLVTALPAIYRSVTS